MDLITMTERDEWEEPGCLLEPFVKTSGARSEEKKHSIGEIIEEFDRLLARDASREAEAFLETWLARFEEAGDWAPQITILNEMMGFFRNSGNREKGMESVKKGLDLVGAHRLFGTVSGGTTLINAATTMKAFGDAAGAIPYYEQAFRAYGECLDPCDYRFGGLFNNMALAYEDLGEFEKAEIYYKKAMEIMEALRPGSVLEIAVTWVNLAVLYEKWEKEDEIDQCLTYAVEEFHSKEVLHDAYYAFNCRKCADTFGHFGYFRIRRELADEAERIYRTAALEKREDEKTCEPEG